MSLFTSDPDTPMSEENMPPEVELVEYARAGDSAAFDELCCYYYPSIRLYLVHMMESDEDGEDLTQETFLRAWQKLCSLQDVYKFERWLYRIAKSLALNQLTRQRLVRFLPFTEGVVPHHPRQRSGAGPEESIGEKELLKLALRELSPRYRSCVILQIFHEWPQREIARSLDISEKSVSKYVSRGLEQLRQAYRHLDPEGYSE